MTNCETCGSTEPIGVACVPAIPYSAAYCRTCLVQGADPWWLRRAQILACGGVDEVVPEFLDWWTFTQGVYMTIRDALRFEPVTKEEIDEWHE
jgi:hypothetical protein